MLTDMNKVDISEQKKFYTTPCVKLHNFGLADIICESGCAGMPACTQDSCTRYESSNDSLRDSSATPDVY